MKLEPMTPADEPVLTKRLPEPPVEVCFASRLTDAQPVMVVRKPADVQLEVKLFGGVACTR